MAQPADRAVARALLAVARMVHAEMERAGLVADDMSELMLACIARWCDGEATDAEVQQQCVTMNATELTFEGARGDLESVQMHRAVAYYLAGHIGGRGAERLSAKGLTLTMAWLCLGGLGEAEEAAKARVEAVYAAALLKRTEGTTRQDDGG